MKTIDYLIIVNTNTPGGQEVTKADIIEHHTTPKHLDGLGLNRPRIDDLISLEGELVNIIPETSMNEVDLWGIAEGLEALTGQPKYVALVGGRTKTVQSSWIPEPKSKKRLWKPM